MGTIKTLEVSPMTQASPSGSGFGDGPIRVGGSSFSRPAALIGGAAALIALTAIATTLVVRPAGPAVDGAEARNAPVAATALLSSGSPQKASGQVGDEAAPAPKPAPVATERKVAATPAAPKAPAAQKAPAPQKVASVCSTCGVIEAVTPVTQKGDGTGVGAVGGAVVGGLLGSQIGGGKGKDAMTAIGVVGGGIAGHEIEKRQRATTVYAVKVRMDDGSTRTVTQSSAPAVGAKVTLEGSQLKARAS
jgi:outer membrane lipoprotein SlyB